MSLPMLETFTGFRTARGDYLPNRFRILLGTYERDELRAVRPLVANARVIFDVGANVGFVSRFFVKSAPAGARICSFEPNPTVFALLERNLEPFQNVHTFNFGLSKADAELPLFLAGNDHSVGSFASAYPAAHRALQDQSGVHSVTAKVVRGDSFTAQQNIRFIDVLKIDVEGWELNVLEGLEQTINRSPQLTILCEHNARAQRSAGHEPHELAAWLIEHGFKLAVNDDGVMRELPRDPENAISALPAETAYPTLFATRT